MKEFCEVTEKIRIILLLFSILSFILMNAACAKKESIDTIKLRVVWVTSAHSNPLTKEGELWLKNVKKFYFDKAHVKLEFQNVGKIKVDDFFSEEFDHLPKSPILEKFRFNFERGGFDINKEEMIRNLKRVGLNNLKQSIYDEKARSYEDIYNRVKKFYLSEIELFNSQLDRQNLKYQSATNWLYILQNTQKYNLIITDEAIINDSYDPLTSISILHGAIAYGFAVPDLAVISTASLDLIPKEYHDNFMQYNLIHELGHALFRLPHSDPKTRSVMSIKPSWDDIKAPKFTDKELDLITANVLMREGDKLANLQDYSQAIDKYNEAITHDPNCFACYYQLSRVYCGLRDVGSCVSCLESTTRLNPGWFLPYENLGDLYFKFFRSSPDGLNNATKNYKKAIKLEPSNIDLHLKLAKCYEEAEEIKYAAKEYLTIIKIDPTNSTAVHALEKLGNNRVLR
jgi:tetratricopeptide (TPR) repeat protein